MSREKLVPGEPPAAINSAGQMDPLSVSASQRAWRQALLEELRAAWRNAEEMLEILAAAPTAALAVEECAADTRKQLDVLKDIFGRLNEAPPSFPGRSSSVFWKLEALSADPAGPNRDSDILQALHSQALLVSQQWQSALECCIRCGMVDVAELLQAGVAEPVATEQSARPSGGGADCSSSLTDHR
jgi:hypothetical protein